MRDENTQPPLALGAAIATGLLLLATMSSSVAVATTSATVQAVTEDRDASFGDDGLVLVELPPEYNGGGPIPVEAADGGVFVIDQTQGLGEIVVFRFTATGQVDASFGTSGQVVLDLPTSVPISYEFANNARLDAQGRLVIVAQGYSDFLDGYQWMVLRMNPDGTLDNTFGSGGVFESTPIPGEASYYDYLTSIDIDSQGRIVFGGVCCLAPGQSLRMVIGRLTASGTFDPTFGGGEMVMLLTDIDQLSFAYLAVDSADRIVGGVIVADGGATGLFRLTAAGAIDGSFGTNGGTIVDFGPSGLDQIIDMVIDEQDRILVAENMGNTIFVGRFLPNGKLDLSYGQGGLFTYTEVDATIVMTDAAAYPGGRVVVSGSWFPPYGSVEDGWDQLVVRINGQGMLDPTFSGDGVAKTDGVPGAGFGDDATGRATVDSLGRIITAAQSWTGGFTPDRTAYLSVVRYLAESDGPIDVPPDVPPPSEDPPPTGTFTDDDDSIFEADIEWLAASGITKGCNPPTNDRFCPTRTVTRGQMAAFLHRALPDLPVTRAAIDFTDDDESIFEADIEWLYSVGVTQGNSPTTFNPTAPVTRGQMAAFLVRALKYTDDGGGDLFIDDDASQFRNDIDRLGTAGVTKGCNPPTNDKFCPDGLVTRGQMAAFLHRALGG